MKTLPALLCLLSIAGFSFGQSYVWTQKSNLPAVARGGSMGFSLNNKGYIVGGLTSTNIALQETWQWNPLNNSWTQKANLPGPGRHSGVSFKISNKGYIATGWTANGTALIDLWEYNSTTNIWTQKSNFAGTGRYTACSFVISNYAYVGLGYFPLQKDFWRYDGANNSWTQMADISASERQSSTGFAIGNYGYVVCGNDGGNLKELWRYDPAGNSWLKRADFQGSPRYSTTAFIINNKAIVGTGSDGVNFPADFYSYNPTTDLWSAVAALPSNGRISAACFTINGKGYINGGRAGTLFFNDLWEYGPAPPAINLSSLPVSCNGGNNGSAFVTVSGGTPPYTYSWNTGATTASISGLTSGTYSVTVMDAKGLSSSSTISVTQPNQINLITSPSISICKGQSTVLTATANGGTPPYTYSWNGGTYTGTSIVVSPSITKTYSVILTDANGCTSSSQTINVTVVSYPVAKMEVSNFGIGCYGDSIKLATNSSSGLTYKWKRNGIIISGAIDSVYYAKSSGIYNVVVTNQTGCSTTSGNGTVNIIQLYSAITPSGTVTMCQGDTTVLSAIPTSGYYYQWKKNNGNINGATQSKYKATTSGSYKVKVTDPASGCGFVSSATTLNINCKLTDELTGKVIFPNPSNNSFTFDFSHLPDNRISIVLYDISGRLLNNYQNVNPQIKFTIGDNLMVGTYFVKVHCIYETLVYRIIKSG